MKILFLIGNDIPTAAVSEWEEMKKYKRFSTPSKGFYDIFKALEQNKAFEKEIQQARKNVGISEHGMKWEDYYFNWYMESLKIYSGENKEKFDNFFSKVSKETKRIKSVMKNLNPYISNQLENLIIGSFVFPEDFPITHKAVPIDEMDLSVGYGEISIHITHKLKIGSIISYLKKNKKELDYLMDSLPTSPIYYISKKGRRIVELKDRDDLEWPKIEEIIIKEFGIYDEDGEINITSIERMYRRAKKRIYATTGKQKVDK